MNHFLAQLCFLIPVGGEALFDWVSWRVFGEGKDKPWSTYVVRPILFLVAIALVVEDPFIRVTLLDKAWYEVLPVVVMDFVLFFPLVINLIRGEHPCYLGKGPYDKFVARVLPYCYVRYWLFVWLTCVANCYLYYYELKWMFY